MLQSRQGENEMELFTKCLHAGYSPQNGQPRVAPIVQSTTFRYDSAEQIASLFDLESSGFFYSRIGNPTVDMLEQKIASLEGGIGALCTSSGQAANLLAILNLAKNGDHVISSTNIYGGSFNIMTNILKRFGIETTLIDQDANDDAIAAAIKPNTRLIYGETLANPALSVLDIERIAGIAHAHGVPLIVDNTFATPALCRPLEYGADIVTHSTTKYMDGHAVQLGGAIVDGGSFDWTNGRFPEFVEPDQSYHGLVYSDAFGPAAYIAKARVQLMRDMGCCQSAQGAFYTNLGLETLPLRMQRHSENALRLAKWLACQPRVQKVSYPGLPGDKYHALSRKYLPHGASGVLTVVLEGGREAGVKFINKLKLVSIETHVADIRTCVLHPASSTHRQLQDDQLALAGVEPGLLRISTGLENVEDIVADIEQALA